MKLLVTSDTHFSDRPRDVFKFGIFNWLLEQKKHHHDISAVIFAGDLTEFKDRHPAVLVNRIVDGLTKLSDHFPVFILRANHDCIDPENPFFKFLNLGQKLWFISRPEIIEYTPKIAMIPHCRTQDELDKACKSLDPFEGAFVHQTFEGAIAESGVRMSGIKWPENIWARWVYSGDIHKPQTMGNIIYIGSPWHNRFGDDFQPRVLLIDEATGKSEDLYFPAPRKRVLKVRDAEEIYKDQYLITGDHVKVELQLSREELSEWPRHRESVLKACQDRKLEVFGVELKIPPPVKHEKTPIKTGISNGEVFDEFCLVENVPSAFKRVGSEILNDAK